VTRRNAEAYACKCMACSALENPPAQNYESTHVRVLTTTAQTLDLRIRLSKYNDCQNQCRRLKSCTEGDGLGSQIKVRFKGLQWLQARITGVFRHRQKTHQFSIDLRSKD